MKVLRIITTVEPHVGGPSYSATNAAIAEQGAGTQTTLVSTDALGDAGFTPPGLAESGVRHRRFRRVGFAPELAARWGISPGFVRWIFRNGGAFDVIHVHYVWSVGTVAGVLAGLLWRRPVVMTPHESLTEFDIVVSRSRLRTLQKRAVRWVLLRSIRKVIVASELERRDSRLSSDQATVVAHPVMRTADTRTGDSPTAVADFDVGFLGRLHEKKRVALLLDAVASADHPVSLIIGGNHPPEQYNALRQHAAGLTGTHRVEFAGFVPSDRKAAFFDGISVLAMPSQYECFGMVAAEAMASGTPVIVSHSCGVADVVERHDAGAVVATDDEAALRAAIERFVTAGVDQRRAMGQRARAAAETEFSFESYGRTVLDLYRALRR
jgi:glycosyltransferase involved in cell wall biosynthesis